MKRQMGEFDPRNPKASLLAVALLLGILGFAIWLLVTWPRGVLFGDP